MKISKQITHKGVFFYFYIEKITFKRDIIIAIIFFIALLAAFDGFSDTQNDRKAKSEQTKNIEKQDIHK